MKTILKYQFPQALPGEFGVPHEFAIPDGATIVDCGFQGNKPTIWMLLETTNTLVTRAFMLWATGKDIPAGWHYVATSHKTEYPSHVWHWLEKDE